MSYGLSDRDRERLEKGRKDAAVKMAAERRRIDEQLAEEKELAALQQEHLTRLGPVTVTGPDGEVVRLWVAPSGIVGFSPDSAQAGDAEGCLVALPFAVIVLAPGWLCHKLFFRSGSTLHIKIPGRRKLKFREPDEAWAADRLRRAVRTIERNGAGALKR